MRLSDIMSLLEAEPLNQKGDFPLDVQCAFASDLMSDVLALARRGDSALRSVCAKVAPDSRRFRDEKRNRLFAEGGVTTGFLLEHPCFDEIIMALGAVGRKGFWHWE
jgi:hypothetical protein